MFDLSQDLHYPRSNKRNKRIATMRVGPYTFTKCDDYRDAPELPGIVIARCSKSMNAAVFQTANVKRFIANNRTEALREGKVRVQTCLVDYLKDHPRRSLTFGYLLNHEHPMVTKKDIRITLLVSHRQLATQRRPKRYVVSVYRHKHSGAVTVNYGYESADTGRQIRLLVNTIRRQRISIHGNANSERVEFKIKYPYVEKEDFERVVSIRVSSKELAEKRKAELMAHYSKQTTVLNF